MLLLYYASQHVGSENHCGTEFASCAPDTDAPDLQRNKSQNKTGQRSHTSGSMFPAHACGSRKSSRRRVRRLRVVRRRRLRVAADRLRTAGVRKRNELVVVR
eukprot:TRINITY_DN6396_c0_g3_i1.p4 TRINITY_DN6396_c0_g3~~TRINITY_DN6396_c0_g3_i1.p4  ORF type:complete len:102 (-),score=3.85 TRINITY_DN6396_c0_g3_i1:161-466(-)